METGLNIYLHHPCTSAHVSVISLTCSYQMLDVINPHYSQEGTQLNERHFSILGWNGEAAFPEIIMTSLISTCQSAQCV